MNCCSRSTDKASSKKTKDSQEKSMEKEIRELFRLFDTNNDRSISAQELGKAMRFLGMSPTQQEVSDAMRALDVNDNFSVTIGYLLYRLCVHPDVETFYMELTKGNGRIEFQEFYTFMQNEMAKISDGDYTHKEEVIRSAFRTFDKDGNGFIDAKELRTAMKKLGECLTDKELEDMMKQADVDGDGKINYEEFVKIWCEAS